MSDIEDNAIGGVAIIGMAGRFPGADTLEKFWVNLQDGVESVTFFNNDELLKLGVDKNLIENRKFVAADAILDGMDLFDAAFFDYSAREAEITDPQHRLFLESAWEVLESAGYSSEFYEGRVAVYASANLSGYMIRNLNSNIGLPESVGSFKMMLANGQDFLSTKVSYKMDLTGPSVNVNTLCSSSLVATHYACQNLLNYGCDLAIAGGVSFQVSRNDTLFYQEGGIGSSDGHCHAFDSKANGTVSGSGLAVVVLKRLEDAIADGDNIYAVIKGTGINNDGASKNSYTAPNVEGQAECIAEAIAVSGINPETITYVEAHGTGTDLGDPIEIAALTKSFKQHTNKKQFCAVGSVKTNIGHLVNAGGLASVVKTALAMQHRVLPPSLNFESPNPKIDFANTPFYVNTKRAEWKPEGGILRAGVSSFGIGGTNAHIILEEAPGLTAFSNSTRPLQLITLSAKTQTALKAMNANLLGHLKKNPSLRLEDIAYTLQVGRRTFNYKEAMVCKNVGELVGQLETEALGNGTGFFQKHKDRSLAFLFCGNGSCAKMGLELYRIESVFKKELDACSKIIESLIGVDLLKLMGAPALLDEKAGNSGQGQAAEATLFSVQYALAKQLKHWGIQAQTLIGEGVGEYVAVCVADLVSLEDALLLLFADAKILAEKIPHLSLKKSAKSYVSCLLGQEMDGDSLRNPAYWLGLREPHKIDEKVRETLKDESQVLLSVGSGVTLKDLANSSRSHSESVVESFPSSLDPSTHYYSLLESIGALWTAGVKINWNLFYRSEKRNRIPLPTYPFERQRYWIEPANSSEANRAPDVFISTDEEVAAAVADSSYKEASFTVSLDSLGLPDARDSSLNGDQLRGFLRLKEEIDSLVQRFSSALPKIKVSQLGLKTSHTEEQSSSVKRKLIKKPRPNLDVDFVAPRNEPERIIAEAWQNLLGYEAVGVHDDFFDLGGHSLIAAAMASELSKSFDVQIPMGKIFESTTIEGTATLIDTYKWASQSAPKVAADIDSDSGTI
ncbi:MAG: acyltransferase domain-containing protein [Chitinophagaceae bacterium]|nr:acyltransferase domain-containing protein [Anaerolineae bacterium]